MVQNKWQNGFVGADGVIWGVPLKGETVLTITPNLADPTKEPTVKTVGGALHRTQQMGRRRRVAMWEDVLHAFKQQAGFGNRPGERRGRR